MSRRQNENSLQRDIVNFLNQSDLGCIVSRIKNQGTYDPTVGAFRRNSMEKGIPDIIGCTKDGKAIFIEVKMLSVEGKAPPLSNQFQKEYLKERAKRGAIVGFAYDINDARDIVADDPENYPRKDRTYGNKKFRLELAQGTGHEARKIKGPTSPLDFLHAMRAERGEAQD